MNRDYAFFIGIMSGTSLDGIDFVYVKFNKKEYSDFKILEAETISYSEKWKYKLQNAIDFSDHTLKELNVEYGNLLGKKTNNFIHKFNIDAIDFVASHGHTVLHQPQKGITLQIGDGQTIANLTKEKVICDFRTQDVELGGQGAPLVPIGDELLFSSYDFCLNLGGFSNISFLKKDKRIAFDICPVNIVLNHYASKLGLEFDESGIIASKGVLNKPLLENLNALKFYKKEAPKSLGLEWVQKEVFPIIDHFDTNIPSILRTFVEHIAIQISKIILNNNNVLITGGGVFNSYLIQRIEYHSKVKFTITNSNLINFKEALIFAFLGLLRVDNQVNCLSSVTGAKKDHSSGKIFYPKV